MGWDTKTAVRIPSHHTDPILLAARLVIIKQVESQPSEGRLLYALTSAVDKPPHILPKAEVTLSGFHALSHYAGSSSGIF